MVVPSTCTAVLRRDSQVARSRTTKHREGEDSSQFNPSMLVLEGCSLIQNSAGWGGAIFGGTTVTLRRCTLYGNSASGEQGGGAGIFLGGNGVATIENTIIGFSVVGQAVTLRMGRAAP